jgi:hypothetical protein
VTRSRPWWRVVKRLRPTDYHRCNAGGQDEKFCTLAARGAGCPVAEIRRQLDSFEGMQLQPRRKRVLQNTSRCSMAMSPNRLGQVFEKVGGIKTERQVVETNPTRICPVSRRCLAFRNIRIYDWIHPANQASRVFFGNKSSRLPLCNFVSFVVTDSGFDTACARSLLEYPQSLLILCASWAYVDQIGSIG